MATIVTQLSLQEQYDKMIQERDALHMEVLELDKAEPLQTVAGKIADYLDGKVDPLLNPNENEWVRQAAASTGC